MENIDFHSEDNLSEVMTKELIDLTCQEIKLNDIAILLQNPRVFGQAHKKSLKNNLLHLQDKKGKSIRIIDSEQYATKSKGLLTKPHKDKNEEVLLIDTIRKFKGLEAKVCNNGFYFLTSYVQSV